MIIVSVAASISVLLFLQHRRRQLNFRGNYLCIGTISQLSNLVKTLHLQQEPIGIDTEFHPTYGLCLIQLATPTCTALIDVMILPQHQTASCLSSLFSDSSILKVFHGGSNDIKWLKAYGIKNINGIWDTLIACNILKLKAKSLYGLLHHFAEGENSQTATEILSFVSRSNKERNQRADWRQRPLNVEMMQYAINDCKYLLWLQEKLLNLLCDIKDGKSKLRYACEQLERLDKHRVKNDNEKIQIINDVEENMQPSHSQQREIIKNKRRAQYDVMFN